MRDLTDRICLVTGAASGIGRATALLCAEKGAALVLTDVQAEALEQTAADCRGKGATVHHVAALDVSDHEAVVAFAADVHAVVPSVDVVMNIAGISTWGSIETLEHHHWQRLIDVNLLGPISMLEAFVPAMIQAGRGGHVVNVSSAAGLFGLPWHAAYSASKFGIRGVSEVLRFDLARYDIGVSLVCPGAVKTPLVGTVDIVGVDKTDPRMAKETARFEKHAVSPGHVARCIVTGIEKDRYLVLTSPDVKVGWWAQRLFAPGYRLAMKLANDRFHRIASRAPAR